MNKDEIYDSVIEMAGDIRYMREDISELKRELKENAESNEKRISDTRPDCRFKRCSLRLDHDCR